MYAKSNPRQITCRHPYRIHKSIAVVDTIPSLNAFRKWIEKRIKGENGVQFINISCGAYIDGMDNLRPEEYRKLNHD